MIYLSFCAPSTVFSFCINVYGPSTLNTSTTYTNKKLLNFFYQIYFPLLHQWMMGKVYLSAHIAYMCTIATLDLFHKIM
uniref:Uncharacterized protein n=1 Tax=Arundo donax TaxID=35708 RepID=A0A0A9BZR4_ARUDO